MAILYCDRFSVLILQSAVLASVAAVAAGRCGDVRLAAVIRRGTLSLGDGFGVRGGDLGGCKAGRPLGMYGLPPRLIVWLPPVHPSSTYRVIRMPNVHYYVNQMSKLCPMPSTLISLLFSSKSDNSHSYLSTHKTL